MTYTLMPAAPVRLHLSEGRDQWLGDSPHAIDVAAAKATGRDGGKFTDTNVSAAKDNDMCLHSDTARLNGFWYIVVRVIAGREVRRKMTPTELNRPLLEWTGEQVKRWRRTLTRQVKKGKGKRKARGYTYASTVRPYSYGEMVAYAKKKGVQIIAELKSRAYRLAWVCKRVVMAAVVHHALPYFMSLVNMAYCREKAEGIHAAGGHFAVLAHGHPMPKDFPQWAKSVDRVYGATWMGK